MSRTLTQPEEIELIIKEMAKNKEWMADLHQINSFMRNFESNEHGEFRNEVQF